MANIAGIPEVIHDFNLYTAGSRLVGITGEVVLPDFEAMTETISGAGILGEIDASVIGRFGSMEIEIPFRVTNKDYFDMIDPTQPADLTLRAAQQYQVKTTQAVDWMGMRVVVRGQIKKLSLGTVKQGGAMEASITVEITYIMIELDGKEKLLLDKINPNYRVNGKDKLQKVRQLT